MEGKEFENTSSSSYCIIKAFAKLKFSKTVDIFLMSSNDF